MATTPWSSGQPVSTLLDLLGLPDNIPTIDGDTLTIDGCDQAQLDAALAQYNSDPEAHQLRPVRLAKQQQVISQAAKFVAERYPTHLQTMYIALMVDALINGLNDRMAYIATLLAWVKSVAQKSIDAEAAIGAAATTEEIKAVTIDLEDVKASDPQTSIKTALGIDS